MPRIAAATVAENRELRRESLLAAAATLLQRQGAFTVAEVAKEVGLSRSAVYEYYSSAAELIADVVVDELAAWVKILEQATLEGVVPEQRRRAWTDTVLDYVADGRHALLRAAARVEVPDARRAEMGVLHQAMVAPLVRALADEGLPDPALTARYVYGVLAVAIDRIEIDRADPDVEHAAAVAFIDAAIAGQKA